MNTIIRQVLVASLAAAAAATFAASDAPAVQRVEITAPRGAAAAAQAVLAQRDFETTYDMSTGRRMAVSQVGDGVLVRYGRRAPTVLRHDGTGNFVSQDGQLALQFVLDRAGEPDTVRLTMPANWL